MGRKPKEEKTLNCKEIMTVEEVATLLQIRRETVLRLIESKQLVASRIGRPWRIRKDDLNRYLIENENINMKKEQKA